MLDINGFYTEDSYLDDVYVPRKISDLVTIVTREENLVKLLELLEWYGCTWVDGQKATEWNPYRSWIHSDSGNIMIRVEDGKIAWMLLTDSFYQNVRKRSDFVIIDDLLAIHRTIERSKWSKWHSTKDFEWKQGRRIFNINDFAYCTAMWFMWDGKRVRRDILESLSYGLLFREINNKRIYIAELKETTDE